MVHNPDAWVRRAPTVGGPSDWEGHHGTPIPVLERAVGNRPPGVVDVTGTDRGEERRRLLRAVRSDAESESTGDRSDLEERPEPAPDGGTVALEASSVRCATCDRTYRAVPDRCRGCGAETFVEPSRVTSGDPE